MHFSRAFRECQKVIWSVRRQEENSAGRDKGILIKRSLSLRKELQSLNNSCFQNLVKWLKTHKTGSKQVENGWNWVVIDTLSMTGAVRNHHSTLSQHCLTVNTVGAKFWKEFSGRTTVTRHAHFKTCVTLCKPGVNKTCCRNAKPTCNSAWMLRSGNDT